MKNISLEVDLLYYDYPQIFIGKDAVDARYVCMVTEEADEGPIYLCTGVSEVRRSKLTNGEIDLLSVFKQPELSVFFEAKASSNESPEFSLSLLDYAEVPAPLLPKPGLVFDHLNEVAVKASELNTTVSFVSLSVPEASETARIKSNTLADFLRHYQAVVRNLTKAIARDAKKPLKKDENPFLTDVCGFSRGSFTVHLRSSIEGNLFGQNDHLSLALERLDAFLSTVSDPDAAVALLQEMRGHTASSLVNLLAFLTEHSCPIRHQWSNPFMPPSSKIDVPLAAMIKLVEVCRLRTDLSVEEVKLTGPLMAASHPLRNWTILNESNNEQYSGVIAADSTINLSGLVINHGKYEFYCEEVIEIVPATGKEISKLFLKSFKQI